VRVGHSCPTLLKLPLLLLLKLLVDVSVASGVPTDKVKIKSGGQECPPHTD